MKLQSACSLKRLHREERGQVSFLALVGAICFIGLLSMVINTNDIVTDRVLTQDVADSMVLSSASWTARGLNLVSFVNVLNTKLLSTAIHLNALSDALPVIIAVGNVQRGIFSGCQFTPFVGLFCTAMLIVVNIQLYALNILRPIVDRSATLMSKCSGNKLLWKFMTALEGLADGVRLTFGGIGIAESISIAEANGFSGIAVNGKITSVKDQLQLPVKKDDFDKFCPKLEDGGSGYKMQGFTCGKGPLELGHERMNKTLLLPFTTLLAHPIYAGMLKSHTIQVGCTSNANQNSTVPVKLKNHQQCRDEKVEARWSQVWSKTVPVTDDNLTVEHFSPWKPVKDQAGGKDADDAEKDLGDLEKELEDLGIDPSGQGGTSGGTQKAMGAHYEDIDRDTEYSVRSFEVPCDGVVYPYYSKPGLFDSQEAGEMFPFPGCFGSNGLNCDRIDRWGEFTWFSGEHIQDGAKTVGGYFMRVTKHTLPKNNEDDPDSYEYIVETISLVDAGTKDMNQAEFQEYLKDNGGGDVNTEGSQDSAGCDKPQPWMLTNVTTQEKKDFDDKLRFIGLVWLETKNNLPFWSTYFAKPPDRIYAYAQAQVYNHLEEDTFTQDWRVRLEKATLLQSFLGSTENTSGGLKGLAADTLGVVNNH